MQGLRMIVTALAVLLLSVGPTPCGGDANVLVGQKSSEEDLFDAAGVDEQLLIGVTTNLSVGQPFLIAIDILATSDDASLQPALQSPTFVHTDVDTIELALGVRKTFGERLVPFIGGGVSWTSLDVEQTVSGTLGSGSSFIDTVLDDSDDELGFWVGTGLFYRVRGRVNIGLDIRYTSAEPSLSPVDEDVEARFEAGGVHYGLMVGYHW